MVDSSFLAQADGSYGGGAISDFFMQIGTQVYDQTTAFSPDLQGIELQNNEIVGVAMNWEQTSAGLLGPFTQWAEDGTWFAGSTVDQSGDAILQGPAGSQSFTNTAVPEPSTWAMMMFGFAGLGYAGYRRGARVRARRREPVDFESRKAAFGRSFSFGTTNGFLQSLFFTKNRIYAIHLFTRRSDPAPYRRLEDTFETARMGA